MSKQLMFYEKVVPVNPGRHSSWSVLQGTDYRFAGQANAAPLMCAEFQSAAPDLPVVFGKSGDVFSPIVIMGIEPQRNLFVDADGGWIGPYLPAFIRRYPFVFAQGEAEGTFTLCLDETYPGCDPEGAAGRKLFDGETPSEFLNSTLEFTKTYETEQRRSLEFCRLLDEHDLLEPMQAAITMPDGQKRAVTGFFIVSRERLKALSGEVLTDFFRRDALELIYYHMLSLRNMEKLRNYAV